MHLDLHDHITSYFRVTPVQKIALKKLGIESIRDLLYHFPVRYGDTAEARSIDSLRKGDVAVIYGKVGGLEAAKTWKSKVTMAEGYIEDETGKIHCVWFNQPYLAKMYSDGMLVRIEGKVSERRKKNDKATNEAGIEKDFEGRFGGRAGGREPDARPAGIDGVSQENFSTLASLYFSNPKIERVDHLPTGVGDSLFGDDGEAHTLYPIYPESRGITSLWIYHAILKLFKNGGLDIAEETIPDDILKKYNLPGIKTALIWIHTPLKRDDALSARKRFSFEEVFTIQLGKQQIRKEYEMYPAFQIKANAREVSEFVKRFPFSATNAQNHAIETILADMEKDHAMSRLLEGDVGSGKTAVAATTVYSVVSWRANSLHGTNSDEDEKSLSSAFSLSLSPSDRLQVAYMCPTEILATQHFESFIQYFAYLGIQIALITSSGCRKFPSKVNPKGWTDISRTQLLKWVENGEIPIVIGTHSLIQKSVKFKHLAYVIIDEQHRFGTSQRAQLVKKNGIADFVGEKSEMVDKLKSLNVNITSAATVETATSVDFGVTKWSQTKTLRRGEEGAVPVKPQKNTTSLTTKNQPPAPHLLSMTATPIPRTLALTMFGDLDLTLLDESPAGRKPIITEIVLPNHRDSVYEKVRAELVSGRQAYVICPRIDEPDPDKELALNAKSVKEEARRLKEKVFPEYTVGILHGKMRPAEKDKVMDEFKNGKINILCATSVVEVGVNVPNATVILIEGAERFGLAQLHQLRGRVQRSSHQAYCYAFTESNSEKSIARLHALSTAKNGFELAELDLAQRGSGQLSGLKQWGVSDVAMEALKNLKMVEAARTEALRLIETDATLSAYPLLQKEVQLRKKEMHFE